MKTSKLPAFKELLPSIIGWGSKLKTLSEGFELTVQYNEAEESECSTISTSALTSILNDVANGYQPYAIIRFYNVRRNGLGITRSNLVSEVAFMGFGFDISNYSELSTIPTFKVDVSGA